MIQLFRPYGGLICKIPHTSIMLVDGKKGIVNGPLGY